MLLGGMFAGLIAFEALPSLSSPGPGLESGLESALAPGPPSAGSTDPWAEARRSKAILEAQEGRPPPLLQAPGDGGPGAVRAARTVRAGGRGVRVIDGDTFVHAGTRIRIADIDTPEVQGRCPEESALAARATRRLEGLLAQGAFELHPLPSGRDEDRYGRKLRIVTRGGRSIGDVLVAEGLARTWTGRREPWCG